MTVGRQCCVPLHMHLSRRLEGYLGREKHRRQVVADKLTPCSQLQESSSTRPSRPLPVTVSSSCSFGPSYSNGPGDTCRINNEVSLLITTILKPRAHPL
ncbi:hypothetical protein HPB50_028876 [Hyalomma asiaticum]|nr:hypothetical protein HPB50_028876 [Hyalomma asiaticum]